MTADPPDLDPETAGQPERIEDLRARAGLARVRATQVAAQRVDAGSAYDVASAEHRAMPVLQARDRDAEIAGREARAAHAYVEFLAGAENSSSRQVGATREPRSP